MFVVLGWGKKTGMIDWPEYDGITSIILDFIIL